MVYADINDQNTDHVTHKKSAVHINMHQQASALQRILAVLLDYLILSPLISFVCVSLFTQGLQLYQKFPHSLEAQFILVQIGVAFVFLFTLLQTVFIYFAGGTPGQIFTKTFVEFKNKESNLFFQAWLRQLGFAASVLLLGIPFLAVLYQRDQRTLFERMTESTVNTYVVNPLKILNWGKPEYRYISVFFSIFLFFGIGLSLLSFKHIYEKTLTSNFKYEKLKNENYFCDELKTVKQENKLTVATALNLVGVLSDHCLNLEADFVLWNNFSDNDRSMAYFAKFVAVTENEKINSNAEESDSEDEYLAQVCKTSDQSQACKLVKTYATSNVAETFKTINTMADSNLLISVLKFKISREQNLPIADVITELEKYDTLKSVNKFLIREQLNDLQFGSLRSPASNLNDQSNNAKSDNKFSDKIKSLQKRIDQL